MSTAQAEQIYNHVMKVTGVTLNDGQKELALSNYPVKVCAAIPGSGKTNTLKYQVAFEELIHRIPPKGIHVMTFTNKATDEFSYRHAELMKQLGLSSMINISTIHAFCKKYVTRFHNRINIPKPVQMMEEDSKEFLRKIVLVVLKLDKDKLTTKRLNDIYSCISFLDNRLLFTKEEVMATQHFIDLEMDYEHLAVIREINSDSQRENGKLSFDEIMLVMYDILRQNESLLHEMREDIQSLFVDEYQDTNKLQLEIIKMLVTDKTRFTVVGDNDQSIFRWRGAVDTFYQTMQYKPNYKLIQLNINYRCPDYAIACANALIRNTEKRIPVVAKGTGKKGKLTILGVTSNRQASMLIAEDIINDYLTHGRDNYRLMRKLVLYRNHSQGMFLVYELAQNKIPVNTSGVLVPHRDAIVKDILAMCSLLTTPRNSEKANKIMYKFNSFINRPKSNAECPFLNSDEKTHFAQVETKFSNNEKYLDEINLLQRAEKIIKDGSPVIKAFEILIPLYMKSYYLRYNLNIYQGKTDEDLNAIQDFLLTGLDPNYALDQFEYVCQQVDKFVFESNRDNVGVQIMSIHSAKGLEAEQVYLLDMNGSVQPNAKTVKKLMEQKAWDALEEHIHEERSLVYVAITRTKCDLFVTYNIKNPSPFNLESGLNVDKKAYANVLPLWKLGHPVYVAKKVELEQSETQIKSQPQKSQSQPQTQQQTQKQQQGMDVHQQELMRQMNNPNTEKERNALDAIKMVQNSVLGSLNEEQQREIKTNSHDPFANIK